MNESEKNNDISTQNSTLHLNGRDFENFELQLEPVDHEKAQRVQESFSCDMFYGSRQGLRNMSRAERETRKFDARTRDRRINPEVNHDRGGDTLH
jgi:hypothetical protein